MKKTNNPNIKSKGTTLIEMLAAVAIFSLIVGAISGIFISGIRTQRRVLATQELLDQTSYVLEYMGRTIRMAKKDLEGVCLAGAGYNFENPIDSSSIRFIDYENKCRQFSLEEGQIVERKSSSVLLVDLPATGIPITSDKMEINSLIFNLSGEEQPPADLLQPRVTIFLKILGRESAGQPQLLIQTSISQRELDIQRQ